MVFGEGVSLVEAPTPRVSFRYRDEDVVQIIVAYTETPLRDKLKIAGGRWDPEAKLWLVLAQFEAPNWRRESCRMT